jgi:hypothetical protein
MQNKKETQHNSTNGSHEIEKQTEKVLIDKNSNIIGGSWIRKDYKQFPGRIGFSCSRCGTTFLIEPGNKDHLRTVCINCHKDNGPMIYD